MKTPSSLDGWIKLLSILGAVVTFGWGVLQFITMQNTLAETKRIEATKPFLERQLKLYTDATQTAATLATSVDPIELEAANYRFWSLYWGELALVEDKEVEAAMVILGQEIEKYGAGKHLKNHSLKLARACRNSLARSWGVAQWRNPHDS